MESNQNLSFEKLMERLVMERVPYKEAARELAKAFPDMSYSAIESRITRYKKRLKKALKAKKPELNVSEDSPQTTSVEYKADGTMTYDRIIALRDGEDLTPEKVMRAHGLDPCMWEVVFCKSNFY